MNAGAQFLRHLVGLLDAAGIPNMVAGSWASATFGEPRTTQGIDIVIEPSAAALDVFLLSLPPSEFYVDPDTARDAMRQRGMFNVIHLVTGWKADLVLRKHRPFSIEELRRRRPATLQGVTVMVATPKDTVVSKLEWSKLCGGSERQRRDVVGVLRLQTDLDLAYIQKWVGELGLEDEWPPGLPS